MNERDSGNIIPFPQRPAEESTDRLPDEATIEQTFTDPERLTPEEACMERDDDGIWHMRSADVLSFGADTDDDAEEEPEE